MATNPFIIFDFETGGLDPNKNAVTEIAMLCVDGVKLQEVGRYESYIKPYLMEYEDNALKYTGLTLELLERKGKELSVVVEELTKAIDEWREKTDTTSHTKKPILVGHNVLFDIGFMQAIMKATGYDYTRYFSTSDKNFGTKRHIHYIDTVVISRMTWAADPTMTSFNLTSCVNKAGLELVDAHKAMNDVVATKELFVNFVNRLRNDNGEDINNKVRVRDEFTFQF